MKNNEFDLQPEEEFDLQPEEEVQQIEGDATNFGEAMAYGFNKMIPLSKQVSAGAESLLSDKSYGQAVKDIEQQSKVAASEHPIGFGIGEAFGSIPSMVASGAAGVYAPLADLAANAAAALTNEPQGEKIGTATGQAAIQTALPLAAKATSKIGSAVVDSDYAQALIKSSGIDELYNKAVDSYNNGMQGISYKSDTYLNNVKERMAKTYSALENSLKGLESDYGAWIRKQVEANNTKVDISDIAEKHLLGAEGGASIANQQSKGKVKQFLENVLFSSPETQPYQMKAMGEKSGFVEKKIHLPPGSPKQVIAQKDVTISSPSNKYSIFKPGAGELDPYTGDTTSAMLEGATSPSKSYVAKEDYLKTIPGAEGKSYSTMEPKVSETSSTINVPLKPNTAYSMDPITGKKTGNVVHDLTYLQQLKQDLHRKYLNFDEGALKTGMSPETDIALNSFKNDIDNVIEQFVPEYRFINSKYADVAESLKKIPTITQLINSGKDITNPATEKALNEFFEKFAGVDSNFAKQAVNDLGQLSKEWSSLVIARPELKQAANIKGNTFQINMANQLGLMNRTGKLSRNLETAKQFKDVIFNALSRSNPQMAGSWIKALNENDESTMTAIASQVAPEFSDIIEPPIVTSKGALNSYFNGKINDYGERQAYIRDVSASKMSNTEKTQRINAVNKDGTAMPLPKEK